MITTEQSKSKLVCLMILEDIRHDNWVGIYQKLQMCESSLSADDKEKILSLLDGKLEEKLAEARQLLGK